MPNYFDQFDEAGPATAEAPSGNFFDQFDEVAAAPPLTDIDPFSPDQNNLRRVMQNFPNERAQRVWDQPTVSPEELIKRQTWKDLSAADKLAVDAIRLERGFKSTAAAAPKGLAVLAAQAGPFPREVGMETAESIRAEQDWHNQQAAKTPEQIAAEISGHGMARLGHAIEKTIPDSPQPSNVNRPLASAFEGAGSLGASMFMAPLGVAPMMSGMFLMELSDAYESEIARQQDTGEPLNPGKASAKASLYAAGAIPLEYIGGAGRLARRWFGSAAENEVRELARKGGGEAVLAFFSERAKDAAMEGGTESLQRLWQDAIVHGKPNIAAALQEGASAAGGSLLLGGVAQGTRLAGHKAGQAFSEARSNENIDQALQESGQQIALEQSFPPGFAPPIDPAETRGNVFDIFDEVASESQSPQETAQASSGLNGTKATLAEAAATPAPASASPEQATQVRTELEALPGGTEDIARPGGKPPTVEQALSNLTGVVADLQAALVANQGNALLKPSGQPDATEKPAQTITGSNVQTGTEMPVQASPGAAIPVGQPPVQTVALPATPNKPTFAVGQKVAVRLSNRSNKEHLARITQLQPDGSAQVQVEGEKTFRMVAANQLMLTKTDRARRAKQEELATVPAEQQEQVKADAAEFALVVEDYAPQLGWAPGEAYDRNTAMQEQGVENARLRNAAIERAMRTVLPDGQWNSVVDRARALPKLVDYLTQQFPGDNSIAKRRALEQFSRSETEASPALEQQQAIVDRLAASNPGLPELKGLRAVGVRNAGAKVQLRPGHSTGTGGKPGLPSAATAEIAQLLERLYDLNIIFVDSAGALPFNGVKFVGTKTVLIHVRAGKPMLTVAGHELLHHIKETHPGLYAELVAAVGEMDVEGYRSRLTDPAYAGKSDAQITEELLGDFLGDSLADPAFLKSLAQQEPNLFKRFARIAIQWLDKLIAKLKGGEMSRYNVDEHIADIEAARDALRTMLVEAAKETQYRKAGIGEDVVAQESDENPFSKDRNEGSDGISKEESDAIDRVLESAASSPIKGDALTEIAALLRGLMPDVDSRRGRELAEAAAKKFSTKAMLGRENLAMDLPTDLAVAFLDASNASRESQQDEDIMGRWSVLGFKISKSDKTFYEYRGQDVTDRIDHVQNLAYPGAFIFIKRTKDDPMFSGVRVPLSDVTKKRREFPSWTASIKGNSIIAERWFKDNGFDSAMSSSPGWVQDIREATDEEVTAFLQQKSGAKFSKERGEDLFSFDAPESVSDQKSRLADEKRKADEAKAKASMQERAGAKLTGADVDTTKEMFGAEVRQDKSGQGALFSKERNENPFYSRLTRAVELSQQGKASGAQWKATIRNSKLGSSTDEFALVGVNDLEDGKTYTKQEVLDYLKANEIHVMDVTLGSLSDADEARLTELFDAEQAGTLTDAEFAEQEHLQDAVKRHETHFSTYQLPGAKEGSYREVLLTVPDARLKLPEGYSAKLNAANNPPNNYKWVVSDERGRSPVPSGHGATPQEAIASYHSIHGKNWHDGHSQYSDVSNPVVRLRFNERTTADGKKLLFLEEVQAPQKGQFEKMPALFQKNWREIAFKWALRHAAENGFDSVGWTTGEQQAERYSLSSKVSHVQWGTYPQFDGKHVNINLVDGAPISFVVRDGIAHDIKLKNPSGFDGKPLADIIGKDIAEKINQSTEGRLKGEGLDIGGTGLKKLYDVDFRNVVNNLPAVKRAGQKVGMDSLTVPSKDAKFSYELVDANGGRINTYSTADRAKAGLEEYKHLYPGAKVEVLNATANESIHSLAITPDIRESVMGGQALFSKERQEESTSPTDGPFRQLQDKITKAEKELMAAIRQHIKPPEGMTKAKALAAKNAAVSKLNRLLAEQLKQMTSATDAARSPAETAELIAQTVSLLNHAQDEISTHTARSEAIPADLTQLRNDLQTRLNVLKGWSDDQAELAANGKPAARPAPNGSRDLRKRNLESATDGGRKGIGDFWNSLKAGLRYLTSPIPELPLTGERAEKSALFRRGYRLFAVENNAVRKEAAEKINRVLEPLTKLGRKGADNAILQQFFQLGNARQRAAMNPAQLAKIDARMAALEAELNKDPFDLFRRLVLYRDLWWRGTYLKNEQGKPITLPQGLIVEDVADELRKLTSLIADHKDGLAITEALRRHYALTEELQKSILAHGEIIPESLRNPLYFPHHVIDHWTGNFARVRATTEEDFRKYLIAPTGSGALIQTDYLKAMMLHTADVLAHNARIDLVQKYWQPYDISEQLKKQHGSSTWNKPWNIPPGYKVFTPYKKLPLRMDYILSREVMAEKLGVLFNDGDLRERLGESGLVLKVKPEDLHAALVAGEKIQWALPAEIADALNGIARREAAAANPGLGHALGLPARALNNFWKKTTLFAPWNWIRYEYGNLSTDAIDKVLAADPAVAKHMARAARELWQSDQGTQSPEFKAAQREGVFETITAGEAGELAKLPQFKAFLTTGEARWDNVRTVLESPMRGSKFREGVFRYAKFLADVERLRAGKEPVYAGAFHGDIEALGEDVDGQRRLLDGDELIFAKAAEISLKTYGDYQSLGVVGQWLRQYAIPFWSWQDVNFRYHANQLRNIADGIKGVPGGTERTAALRYAGIRVVSTLLAVGIAKELWNQFGGVAMGLWDEDDDLESKLSEADRRRGHLLLGKDANGQVKVVYTPSAWSDVVEWTGGQNMKRLFMEYVRGQITLNQFIREYAKQLPMDVGNKAAQSGGPLLKAPYELASGLATFPDVFDQRQIPKAEKWWRFVGGLTDQRVVGTLRAAFDQDYYSQPATEQLQQIILQIRRRDPEQWAYYEAREDASDWKEAKTGKRFEQGSYDAPEALALRNFRKSIYRGDVANAERFYNRLIQFGYTAERLDASIRNQHPLADLNTASRAEYAKTLTTRQKEELELASKYYSRLKALDHREKFLFKSKQVPKRDPNPALLRQIVEDQSRTSRTTP